MLPLITKQVEPGSTVCSDTWKSYTGVAANGYIHRLVEHSEGEYSRWRWKPYKWAGIRQLADGATSSGDWQLRVESAVRDAPFI